MSKFIMHYMEMSKETCVSWSAYGAYKCITHGPSSKTGQTKGGGADRGGGQTKGESKFLLGEKTNSRAVTNLILLHWQEAFC